MRVLLQRCAGASVHVGGELIGEIPQGKPGYLLLAGVVEADLPEDIEWAVRKVMNLKLFPDEQGAMARSLLDIEGDVLLVSQFTLHASTKKGNRPSFSRAAKPDFAEPFLEQFKQALEAALGKSIATGRFGADMQVSLVNDGPVTIWLDSKNRD